MSDYEDEFMCDEDEDYDLEYSEDSNSEPDVDVENQYYNSKVCYLIIVPLRWSHPSVVPDYLVDNV